MSLIGFHRFLIGSAIVFCHGFAIYEFIAFSRDGAMAQLAIGLAFAIGGILLTVYLLHLRRVLKLDQRDRPKEPTETA